MRQKFKMTEEQLAKLREACRPVPMIALQCGTPPSPQVSANDAWKALAVELGFKWDSVEPDGPDSHCFTAEVSV